MSADSYGHTLASLLSCRGSSRATSEPAGRRTHASAFKRNIKVLPVQLCVGGSPRSSHNTPVWPSKSIKRSSLKIICGYSEPVWPKGSGDAKSCLCCPSTQRPVVPRPALARSARSGFQLRLCSPSAATMRPRCKTESTEAAGQSLQLCGR